MKLKILVFATLLSLCSISGSCQVSDTTAAGLKDLITRFQQAILEKDSAGFQNLFFHEKVPFTGIMSKKTEASVQKKNPAFQGVSVSNSQRFIHEICKNNQKQEEKCYNIQTHSDGRIAAVSFDYSFLADDKVIQWGHEKWNLVMAEGSWWITDVIFSIHFPGVEPFPFDK